MDVTGLNHRMSRDRIKFFKRPVMPSTAPTPSVRYSKELTQSETDVKRRDFLRGQQHAADATSERMVGADGYGSQHHKAPPHPRVSFTQTDYRESEAQTDPCTLDFVYDYKDVLPEVSALETMRYGRGLPVRSQEDFEVVEGLKAVKAAKEHLPTVGDHRRSLAQQRIIENESNIERALRSRSSGRRRVARNQQMRNAVQEFAETSAMLLQERLDRLWRHKQQEKEVRMLRIRRIHEKEIRALERKCQIKNERLRNDLCGGRFKLLEKAAKSHSAPVHSHPPRPSRSGRGRGGSSGRPLDDNFLEEYNSLRGLERETSKNIAGIVDKFCRPSQDTKTMSDGYVPRSQRYNHLLDSAYDDIRKTCRDDFVEEVPASPNLHQEPPTPAVSDEDREGEEDDATTFMQKHAEKVLRATVSDQQKTGFSVSSDTEDSDLNGVGSKQRRRRNNFDSVKIVDEAESRDSQIEAFLDQIEGETLGEMMNFLSAELESNACSSNKQEKLNTGLTSTSEEEDKIYDEMTKLTRSTVDRYLDKIILDILYKSAQAVAEKETDQQLGGCPTTDHRRSSTSDLVQRASSPPTSPIAPVNLEIKKRLKILQKSHLMQAHDALMTVLGEIKDTVELKKNDRKKIEDDIRDALESICKPDEVEAELRAAMSTLNLDSKNPSFVDH